MSKTSTYEQRTYSSSGLKSLTTNGRVNSVIFDRLFQNLNWKFGKYMNSPNNITMLRFLFEFSNSRSSTNKWTYLLVPKIVTQIMSTLEAQKCLFFKFSFMYFNKIHLINFNSIIVFLRNNLYDCFI